MSVKLEDVAILLCVAVILVVAGISSWEPAANWSSSTAGAPLEWGLLGFIWPAGLVFANEFVQKLVETKHRKDVRDR